ncbi:MAG: S1 RNA-binding domain-containing protein [Thermoanaerobaculia bacterium]
MSENPAVAQEETASTDAAAPAAREATATAAEAVVDAAPEAAVVAAAESGAPKSAKAARGKRGGKRRAKPAEADAVVAPSAEELAAVPSEGVRQAIASDLPVSGKVIGWNQGGFHVVIDGVTSFCPRSAMELGAPHEPAQYLDKDFLFRILRVEDKGHRLVVSRAAILREERKAKALELRQKIQVGSTVSGRVISLADFGAFVDLGGVEGLIHVSELKRTRVAHPNEVLAVGQEVSAKVVKLGSGSERISLSLRALEPDPWTGVSERFPAGGKFTGKILRKSDFGWFIEIEPGVEGLLHVSQLPPGMNADDPKLAAGESVEGWVREVDPLRKRVALALREVPTSNPWAEVDSKYPEGQVVAGKIEKIAPFGAFIELEPGLTALLPTSEMGLPRGASIGKAYPVGKQVKVQVSSVDARKHRISLTLEGKTLEGSRSDYQAYVKKARTKGGGMGALAAAFSKLREP